MYHPAMAVTPQTDARWLSLIHQLRPTNASNSRGRKPPRAAACLVGSYHTVAADDERQRRGTVQLEGLLDHRSTRKESRR